MALSIWALLGPGTAAATPSCSSMAAILDSGINVCAAGVLSFAVCSEAQDEGILGRENEAVEVSWSFGAGYSSKRVEFRGAS